MSIITNSISPASVNGTVDGLGKDKNTKANAAQSLLMGLFDKQKCSKRKDWSNPEMWGQRLSAGLICNKQHISSKPKNIIKSSILENGINLFTRSRIARRCNVALWKINRKCRSKFKKPRITNY